MSTITSVGAWYWLTDPKTAVVPLTESLLNHYIFVIAALILCKYFVEFRFDRKKKFFRKWNRSVCFQWTSPSLPDYISIDFFPTYSLTNQLFSFVFLFICIHVGSARSITICYGHTQIGNSTTNINISNAASAQRF